MTKITIFAENKYIYKFSINYYVLNKKHLNRNTEFIYTMNNFKIIPLLFILLLVSVLTTGQHNSFSFNHLSKTDGLSDAIINYVYQDSFGYMWFATNDGINKYDGYEFTIYRNNQNDSLSLSNNTVLVIFEDSNKNLWVGTRNGLNLFNREFDNFTRFAVNLNDSNSLTNNYITGIIEDNNNIWIITFGGGLNCYNAKKNKFTHYKHEPSNPHSLSSDWLDCIFKDSKNRIWIGTRNEGLNLFDRNDKTFKRYKFDSHLSSTNIIRSICELSEKDFLLGTDAGLVRFFPDRKQNNFKLYKHNENIETIQLLSSNNDRITLLPILLLSFWLF